LNWGENSKGAYVLTHTASNQATNYYYVVGVWLSGGPGSNPMVINGSGQMAPRCFTRWNSSNARRGVRCS
jgi:hypothetical protein